MIRTKNALSGHKKNKGLSSSKTIGALGALLFMMIFYVFTDPTLHPFSETGSLRTGGSFIRSILPLMDVLKTIGWLFIK
ncbi:hypothetical protein [Halobacillus massiliensis]|uniref:hypothetical protein n=1 Tax=Halobacillus massiliensis TaxID=1926286 RepID=UPI0009E272EE|nr:hypothetical protein [Halobacillus massiliensis]